MSRIGRGNVGVGQAATSAGPVIGPRDPQVVTLPLAPPVSVTLAADLLRRHFFTRRFPQQWYEASQTTLADLSGIVVYPERALGPDPPTVVIGPPTMEQTTITVAFANAALTRRQTERLRFPLQGWTGTDGLGPIQVFDQAYKPNNIGGLVFGVTSNTERATAVVPSMTGTLTWIEVPLKKQGTLTDNVVCELQTDASGIPSGTVIASASVPSSSISTTATTVRFATGGVPFVQGTTYWIVLSRSGAPDNTNFYSWSSIGIPGLSSYSLQSGVWTQQNSALGSRVAVASDFVLIKRALGPFPPSASSVGPLVTQVAVEADSTAIRSRRFIPLAKSLLFPVQTLAQPPPVVTTLLSSFAVAQFRRGTDARRFPLQGWEQMSASESTIAPTTQGLVVADNSSAGTSQFGLATGLTQAGQPLLRLRGVLTSISAFLSKQGSPIDNVLVEIQTDSGGFPSGTVLSTSNAVAGSGLTTTPTSTVFTFSAPVEVTGKVWVVLRRDGTYSDANAYLVAGSTSFSPEGSASTLFSGGWNVNNYSRRITANFTPFAPQAIYQRRNLGPFPPLVINPLPTQQQQTVALGGVPFVTIERRLLQVRQPKSLLFPPATLAQPPPVTAALRALSRARPRHTLSFFIVPATVEPESVALAERTIRVALTRTRPRPTTKTLRGLIFYPATSEISVALTRIRPRPTRHVLTSVFYPASSEIQVVLTRTRPRPTRKTLAGPTTLQVFAGPVETEIAVRVPLEDRRRGPHSRLPLVIVAPAAFTAAPILVTLVRARPRRTRYALRPLIFYPATGQVTVTLVHTRPRPTLRRLYAPATLTPYAIELLEETIRVALVRVRPRPTRHTLAAPTVLQVFTAPTTPLVRTRPRPTAKFLSEPTVVRIPSVEQREDTVTVTVARTRPRPTTHVLSEPTVLQTFAGPAVTTIRTRPRPTVKTLGKPTAVRVPSVEQREDTITVTLVRIRPRPTTKAEFAPTKLIVPSVEQHRRTITVALVKTRPRPTARTLAPPTVVSHPPVGEIVATANPVRDRRALTQRFPNQGQRQRVVRETGSTVTYQQRDPFIGPRPPQIIDPLPGQRAETITTAEVAVRTQREWGRHFPLPGFRQALIRETGQGTSFIEVGFSPFLGVRPPQIVGPLPTQPQQTVTVKTVSVRTRVEQSRHFARFNLAAPTVAAKSAFFGPEVTLVRTRPRPPISRLGEPVFSPATSTIQVTLVRTRPRPTRAVLSLVIYPATGEISVTLGGRTRADAQRRAPHYRLAPPTRLRIPSVEQREDTITVALARTRPRKTSSRRITPTVYPATSTILVALTRARPRPTRTFVRPPAVVRVPAVEQAEETIRVALTRTRPRPTAKFLRAPRAAILTFSTGKPALARIRPSKTRTIVAPPTVIFEERPPERFEVAVQIVRIGLLRRGPYSRLHAPVVVEPTPLPTADQRTIRVVLATQPRVALLRRAPHFKLPVLIPPPPIPGWTDGHTISSFSTSGETVPADATDGTTSADAAADGRVAPVAESDGKTAPSSATDGRDKRSGTP